MSEVNTTIKKWAVLKRPFSYNFYGTHSYVSGHRFKVGGRNGYKLDEKGIYIILGHGMSELVPRDYFDVIEEYTTEVTSTVVTKNVV
jgi:hypothetical protein